MPIAYRLDEQAIAALRRVGVPPAKIPTLKEGQETRMTWMEAQRLMKGLDGRLRADACIFLDVLQQCEQVEEDDADDDGAPTTSREMDDETRKQYQARIERLKREQEERNYRSLIKTVDPAQRYGTGPALMENFGAEMKTMNRQLMSVFNVLITVGGAFVFGFFGITYAYPHSNFDMATRMLIGLVLATVVFFADIYFVIKGMSNDDPSTATFQPFELTDRGGRTTKDKSRTEKKND